MSSPTHAYVRYKDGGRAIVAVSLIKDYAPTTVSDLETDKEVYYRAVHDDVVLEDHYPGDVVLLGVCQADLINRMAKKGIPVPDNIFEETRSEDQPTIEQVLTRQETQRRAEAAKRKKLDEILQPESTDMFVERRLLEEEKERTRTMASRIRELEGKLEEARTRNERLQDLLFEKFDVLLSGRHQEASRATGASSTGSFRLYSPTVHDSHLVQRGFHASAAGFEGHHQTPPSWHSAGPPAAPPATPLACPPAESFPPAVQWEGPGAQLPSSSETSSGTNEAEPDVPLFAEVDNQVHLGKGVYLTKAQWELLMSRRRDSLFIKDTAKALWGTPALQNRSITGARCRRFIKDADKASAARKALTPVKREALSNAFHAYVTAHPSEGAPSDRLKKLNRYLSELLNDLNK